MSDKKKYFMLNENRYATRGIDEILPIELQIFLWQMIDAKGMEGELDYLQVFELKKKVDEKTGRVTQLIVHKQEMPEFKEEYEMPIMGKEAIVGKIFVIDDLTHATMLWASEY